MASSICSSTLILPTLRVPAFSFSDLVDHGSEHLAGTAPVGVEVQQDGLVGTQYLIFKIRSSNFQFSHEKGSFRYVYH